MVHSTYSQGVGLCMGLNVGVGGVNVELNVGVGDCTANIYIYINVTQIICSITIHRV